MRWVEDTYLSYFGENRTSYGVKGMSCLRTHFLVFILIDGSIESLKKTEITGNEDIDGVQRSVGNLVGNTVGANGIAGDVGNVVDKGVLRGNV